MVPVSPNEILSLAQILLLQLIRNVCTDVYTLTQDKLQYKNAD